mmetsp:Transcript_1975/g.6539  ORF Transcript_1975/g.6539 Transcript_1975/m.6539 type:complete len:272 (-) Transcript_1975:376-1191(-)
MAQDRPAASMTRGPPRGCKLRSSQCALRPLTSSSCPNCASSSATSRRSQGRSSRGSFRSCRWPWARKCPTSPTTSTARSTTARCASGHSLSTSPTRLGTRRSSCANRWSASSRAWPPSAAWIWAAGSARAGLGTGTAASTAGARLVTTQSRCAGPSSGCAPENWSATGTGRLSTPSVAAWRARCTTTRPSRCSARPLSTRGFATCFTRCPRSRPTAPCLSGPGASWTSTCRPCPWQPRKGLRGIRGTTPTPARSPRRPLRGSPTATYCSLI